MSVVCGHVLQTETCHWKFDPEEFKEITEPSGSDKNEVWDGRNFYVYAGCDFIDPLCYVVGCIITQIIRVAIDFAIIVGIDNRQNLKNGIIYIAICFVAGSFAQMKIGV